MRLKSLELQGFKSFADKTILSFDRGVTAVVGPNGSGKSNISDAVRWVLGEISSKNIRGKKMEDVIFGGTDNRRPMGFAEVSLTIDNTDPDNKMAIDYDEVTVTRRYYRSGESEYMINRKPVRLKDITELFMNTGIGRTGYSIVSQGRAAEIISQKSDERRNIFEEAAGISKYRQRKNEAERKLVETDDNLIRINDILSELEGRVGPLERDAAKARKYLDLFEAKKAIDVAISVFDISDIKNKAQKYNSDFEIVKHELEMADDSLRSLETQSDKLYEMSQANKLRYEELNMLIRESSKRKFDFEASEKVLENDIKHIKEIIIGANEEKKRISEEHTAASALLASSQETSEKNKNELAILVSSCEKLKKEIEEFDSKLDSLSDKIDSLDMTCNFKKDEVVKIKIDLSSLCASGKSRDERKLQAQTELTELDKSLKLTENRIAQAKKTVSNYSEKISEINSILTDKDSLLSSMNTEIKKLTERQNSLSLDISSKKQRIESLKRMEELFEGYTQSVRAVMSASESGKLSGIIGPVSRIINLDSKYAVAIETALGASIQNIVCNNENDAKSAIRYLKDNRRGRATFYPLNSIKPQYMPENIKLGGKGFIGIASELVKTDAKYQKAIDFLLARTAVYATLDDATDAARANGYRLRAVTLDGQQINAGGSFTGGSVRSDSGILTRSSEIEKITSDLNRTLQDFKANESKINNLSKQIKSAESDRADTEAKIALFTSLSNAENTQQKILCAQRDNDTARKQAILNVINEITDEQSQTENDIEKNKSQIQILESEIAEAEQKFKALLTERDTLTKDQSDIGIRVSAMGIEIERKKKDIEALEYEISIRKDTINSLISKQDIENNKISNANQKLENIAKRIETGAKEAENISDEIDKMQKEISDISEKNLQNELKETKLREETKDITHKREILFRSYTKLESQCENIKTEQDKLTSHLWDEYELTFTAALELDYEEVNAANRADAVKSRNELKGKIKNLGAVNVNAIEEYQEVKTRYDFLKVQFDDLTKSKSELTGVIYKLESEMRTQFISVFNDINKNFKEVFRELFGGGSADLSLVDPDNVLTSGIDINVAPPGKIIKNLSLLSGGEQSFVAIALFFAILKVNPTPFCILDEIEAALDEVNVARFAQYCQKYSSKTQFIVVTHRRGTMESADVLYGVTMYERGISKVLSVNVTEVEQKIGVKL